MLARFVLTLALDLVDIFFLRTDFVGTNKRFIQKRKNIAALTKVLLPEQIKETDAAKDLYSYDESPHPIPLYVNLNFTIILYDSYLSANQR